MENCQQPGNLPEFVRVRSELQQHLDNSVQTSKPEGEKCSKYWKPSENQSNMIKFPVLSNFRIRKYKIINNNSILYTKLRIPKF